MIIKKYMFYRPIWLYYNYLHFVCLTTSLWVLHAGDHAINFVPLLLVTVPGYWVSKFTYLNLHIKYLNISLNIYSTKIAALESCLSLFHSYFLGVAQVSWRFTRNLCLTLAYFHCVPASLCSPISPHAFNNEKKKIGGVWRQSFHHPYLGMWAGSAILDMKELLKHKLD